jgi:DNA repair exonuclease SbcCD ATPase subunit
LPAGVERQLRSAIRRVRFLRTARAVSVLVIVLAAAAGAALLADSAFVLPAEVRGLMLAGWLVLGGWLIFRLLKPLPPSPSPRSGEGGAGGEVPIAAAVEDQFPELAERLTTSVELVHLADEFHGSPQLIARLMQETETESQQLNFREAFPAGRSARWGSAAGVVLVLLLSPALLWPDRYGELARRFLFPWLDATAVPYVIEVTPGDAFAARGRPLTVTTHFLPKKEGIALPQHCTLVRVESDGSAIEDRMISDGDGFSFKIPRLAGDFTYRIEAGKAVSDTYQITAVDPVEIASIKSPFMWEEDSPAITITPPAYARATIPAEKLHEIADLVALQHSQIAFHLKFNRRTVAARLEMKSQATPLTLPSPPEAGGEGMGVRGVARPDEKKDAEDSKALDLQLSSDHREGRVKLPATGDASYRIVLESEHGIHTELEPRKFAVKIDQPPKFAQVFGAVEAKEVNPYDQLSLDIALTDDVGVDTAGVEYRINKGPPAYEPMVLDGKGKQQATTRHRFLLAGKVKDGDELAYRLRAADNRRVPEAGLEPQVVYYPPETEPGKPRWRTLKVAQQAAPLAEQEILARRDDISRRLEAIKEDLLKEQRGVYKLRMESRYQSSLLPEQIEDLRQFRREGRNIDKALRELARTAAESPDFQPLAKRVQEVAEREMQNAVQKLGEAEQQLQRQERDRDLHGADRELAAALRHLEDLRHEAERLAQARMDQIKLENLANREEQLADQTAKEILRDPIKQPSKEDPAGKLQNDQNQLANELQRQLDQSPNLRQALETIRAEQVKQLAERARDLARAQQTLNKAARETEQKQNRDKLAELARRQKQLAEQAAKFAQESRPSAEAIQSQPLKTESARQAAEALQQGDAAQAVQKQDNSARELDRLANDLNKAGEQDRQREAARQLAAKQEALRQRVNEEAQKKDPKLADRLKDMEREQKAIQQAAEKLSTPANNPQAQTDRALASERAAKAAEALQKGDPAKADSRMLQARQALERLAANPSPNPLPGSGRGRGERFEPEAKEARRLAQEQRQLRDEVQKAVNARMPLSPEQAEQLARQEALRRKAGVLAGELLPLGQQLPQVPKIMEAFNSEQGARGAMKQAQTQSQAGNQLQAQQSRQEAGQALNRAAQQMQQAAQQMSQAPATEIAKQQQTGQSLQQAQNQMRQAQNQLNQGQQRPAQNAMRQAAQALQQAAQQLAQQPGTPVPDTTSGNRGVAAGGEPDIRLLGKDMQKYAGKPWGQLPGELRNQILQDMKARYGEDYARIIKLYFEQIAETKEQKK